MRKQLYDRLRQHLTGRMRRSQTLHHYQAHHNKGNNSSNVWENKFHLFAAAAVPSAVLLGSNTQRKNAFAEEHTEFLTPEQLTSIGKFDPPSFGETAKKKAGFPPEFIAAVAKATSLLNCCIGIRNGTKMPQASYLGRKTTTFPKPKHFSQKSTRYGPLAGYLPADTQLGRRNSRGQPLAGENASSMQSKGYEQVTFTLPLHELRDCLQANNEFKSTRLLGINLTTNREDHNKIVILFTCDKQNKDSGQLFSYQIELVGNFDQSTAKAIERYLTSEQKQLPQELQHLEKQFVPLSHKVNNGEMSKVKVWGYAGRPICSDTDLLVVTLPYVHTCADQEAYYQTYNTEDTEERNALINILQDIIADFAEQHPQTMHQLIKWLNEGQDEITKINSPNEYFEIASILITNIGKAEYPGIVLPLEVLASNLINMFYQEKLATLISKQNARLSGQLIQHGADANFDQINPKVSMHPSDTFFVYPTEHGTQYAYAHSEQSIIKFLMTEPFLQGQFIKISERWQHDNNPANEIWRGIAQEKMEAAQQVVYNCNMDVESRGSMLC